MILKTILLSAGITIATNLLVELSKHILKKSKCKLKMELGEIKSEGEIKKPDKKIYNDLSRESEEINYLYGGK
jgi:hypothetical protein